MPEEFSPKTVIVNGTPVLASTQQEYDALIHAEGGRDLTISESVDRSEQARLERKHGGVGGTARTVANYAAHAITFGQWGDKASKKREMREMRELKPGAALAGGILGAGINPFTRAAALAVPRKVRGFTEGAITGVSEVLERQSIAEDPLTGEQAAAALFGGFLVGGGIGHAADVTSKALQKGLARAADRVRGTSPAPATAIDWVPQNKLDEASERIERGLLAEPQRSADPAAERFVDIQDIAGAADRGWSQKAIRNIEEARLQRDLAADAALPLRAVPREVAEEVDTVGRFTDDLHAMDRAELSRARAEETKRMFRKETSDFSELLEEHRRTVRDDAQYQGLWAALEANAKRPGASAADKAMFTSGWTPIHRQGAKGQSWKNLNRLIEDRGDALNRALKASDVHPALRVLDAERATLKRVADGALGPDLQDYGKRMLASNEALTARFQGFQEMAELKTLTSPRLDTINDLLSGNRKRGLIEKGVRAVTLGAVTSAVGEVAGYTVGGAVGLAAQDYAGDLIARRLGSAAGVSEKRVAGAIAAFLRGASEHTRVSSRAASKALTGYAFGPREEQDKPKGRVEAFRRASKELFSQTAPGPDGRPRVTRAARQRIAANLEPVAALSPRLADQIESGAVRQIEYLANAVPRNPGLGMRTGPETWRPSAMEIAAFARKVQAVGDPVGVLERLSDGSLTPEDVEALREVYPETFAQIARTLSAELPTLRKQLPYNKRLMLSIFFGVPVDPAMEPNILAVLQGNFAQEPNTDGGMSAPTPQPQFGSVTKEQPTSAQERAG